MERLDRVHDPRVKIPSPLLQEAAVRDLMRERVREGVLEIRIEPGLIDELGGLQVVESATEHLVREISDRLEQRQRHVLADDGGDLQQTFVLRGEPVDARRQHRLDRRRDLDRLDWLRQPILARLSRQRLCLHQRPDRLLQEERVAALDEELLEWRQPGIVAEERIEQLPGALDRKRVKPHLAVERLAAPGVLVLRTVIHEQQQAS